jgi:hypothetical protein
MINRLKGIGIDVTSLQYHPSPDYAQDFVYTELESNNGFLLSEFIGEGSIIVGTSRTQNLGRSLRNFLKEIGRSSVGVLLITLEDEPNLEEIAEVVDSGLTGCIGINFPKSLKHLKETTEKLKRVVIPKYISLEISPIYFQWDILKWCEENEIGILGFNPFGGMVSGQNVIQSFTIPFLLNFSARYSDIVFLSGRDLVRSRDNSEFLGELIGKESDGMYKMEGNVNQLQKPFKKMVYSSLLIDDIKLPFTNPDFISNPSELSLSLEPIELDEEWLEEKRVDGKVGSIVASVYGMIDTPEINDPCYLLSIIRPEIVEHLKKLGWKVEQVKMGDTIFLIKLQTSRKVGKIRKKVEKIELYFILTVSQKGSPIFFPINKENAEK